MKKLISVCAAVLISALTFAREVTVSVGAGKNWSAKREPQVAVWLESADGQFIRTLYVTERASRRTWIFSPKDGRPESLPVWYNASKNASAKKSEDGKSERGLDAVTSATPKGGVTFQAQVPDIPCVIKAELNASFDYNDFFTKKNSGVNGQPSLVYAAQIPADFKKGDEIALIFAGTGSVDGSDGTIATDTAAHLTTAREIAKGIFVVAE